MFTFKHAHSDCTTLCVWTVTVCFIQAGLLTAFVFLHPANYSRMKTWQLNYNTVFTIYPVFLSNINNTVMLSAKISSDYANKTCSYWYALTPILVHCGGPHF